MVVADSPSSSTHPSAAEYLPGGDYIRSTRPDFPTKVVVAGLVGIILVLSTGIGIRVAYRDIQRDASAKSVSLVAGIERIRYQEEVLSMSARMSAFTGQTRWAERYERAAPQLDSAISETLSALDGETATAALAELSPTAREIIKVQRRVIALAAEGRTEAAINLVDSRDYRQLEARQDDQLEQAFRLALAENAAQQERADRWEWSVVATSILAVAIVVVLGFVTVRSVRRWAGQLTDVTDEFNRELRRLATHDDLTGLYNRRAVREQYQAAYRRARRSGKGMGIVMVDLDHFKAINDKYGHQAGDLVLQEAAKRLTSAAREVDTVARIGGDEFLAIAENIDDASSLDTITQRIRDRVNGPIDYDGQPIEIRTSIGYTYAPVEEADDLEAVFHAADAAMYREKRRNKARL